MITHLVHQQAFQTRLGDSFSLREEVEAEVGVVLEEWGVSWGHFSDRQFAVTVTRLSRLRFSPTFRLALVFMFRMRAPPPFCQKKIRPRRGEHLCFSLVKKKEKKKKV